MPTRGDKQDRGSAGVGETPAGARRAEDSKTDGELRRFEPVSDELVDHKLLKGTLDLIQSSGPNQLAEQPQGICLDKAYDNTEVRELIGDYALTRRTSAHAARRSTSRPTTQSAKHAAGSSAGSSRPATRG